MRHRLRHGLHRAPDEDGSLHHFPTHFEHLRKARPEIDGDRRTDRGEPEIEALDGNCRALVGDDAVAQERTNDGDTVADPLQWLAIGEPMLRFDLYFVTRSQAQNEAALRQMVDRGG